jgi:hypothetical protein
MDRITNGAIRTKNRNEGGHVAKKKTAEHRLRWYGHVMGLENCRVAMQVAQWNPQGRRRRRDKPVNTWKDGIRDSVQKRRSKDKNVSIGSSGGKNCVLGLKKPAHSKKNSFNNNNNKIN